MTQEQKDLLLKDLCSRLPYGVKFEYADKHTLCEILSITPIYDYGNVIYFDDYINHPKKCNIDEIKPFLFPLSSMTEEQKKEWRYTLSSDGNITYDTVDWCNENHLDYRGLIEKGLAIDCTNLNIY